MSKVVVITGASAGVGRACAVEYAKQGAAVALLARGPDGLAGALRDVEAAGGRGLTIQTDVADSAAIERAAERIERELGPIDVWINNAMTTVFAPLHDISADEFRRATEVTYLGTVYGTMAALKRMLPRDRGTIVQVGSALAYRAIPLQSPYCGAKHAIRGMTDSLRSELIHDDSSVRLTMVHLPAVNTPQFSWCETRLPNHPQPVPPIFQPEVAARAIVWAAEHRRREVFVGRSAVMTVWANKLMAGYLDRYLAKHAYAGQQTDQPVASDRPSNLYHPVKGDFGMHGVFSQRASGHSWQWWLTTHRGLISVSILILSCLLLWFILYQLYGLGTTADQGFTPLAIQSHGSAVESIPMTPIFPSTHDHRGTACCVLVLDGVLANLDYALDGTNKVREALRFELCPGEMLSRNDREIYRCGNEQPSGVDLATLHLYPPPLPPLEERQCYG